MSNGNGNGNAVAIKCTSTSSCIQNNNNNDNDDDDDDNNNEHSSLLTLEKLQTWMSKETYEWLLSSNSHQNNNSSKNNNDDDDDNDDESDMMLTQLALFSRNNDNVKDEEEEEIDDYHTVHEWKSSFNNVNGYGGYYYEGEDTSEENIATSSSPSSKEEENNIVKVKYILSNASGGHGDDIWASSRYISNQFANPIDCYELLKPLYYEKMKKNNSYDINVQQHQQQQQQQHPLYGLNVLELGAGGGLPSFTSYKCGAKFVLCTDQSIPDRILCLAKASCFNSSHELSDTILRVAPYDWGNDPYDTLMDELNLLRSIKQTSNDEDVVVADDDSTTTTSTMLFDVIVASDCLYNPQYHDVLLDSIHMLLEPNHGVAILPFALHGNTPDETIWSIVGKALDKNFKVQKLSSKQLLPQSYNMESKRALVHTLRLTKIST